MDARDQEPAYHDQAPVGSDAFMGAALERFPGLEMPFREESKRKTLGGNAAGLYGLG